MGVGVDAAGDDELPRGVDDPGAPRDLEVEADLLDGPVLDVDIRSLSAILIDDLAPLDQDPVKIKNRFVSMSLICLRLSLSSPPRILMCTKPIQFLHSPCFVTHLF